MEIAKRCLGVALLLLTAASAGRAREAEKNWIQLFNGRNLEGWTVKITGYDAGDNFGDTFRVEDGLLKVAYDRYDQFDGRFGHLFYRDSYSHYRLRVEYRFIGEQCPGGPEWAFRNSGIMVHGQTAGAMDKGQDFPVSIEVQLLGGSATGSRPTANVCTPGTQIVLDGRLDTRHCIDSRSETYRGDQWVVVEVEVRGNKLIRHIVDGETVLSYTQPQLDDGTPLGSGSISLQAESHPVEFRRVELLELTD
jgi:hypothetical protein